MTGGKLLEKNWLACHWGQQRKQEFILRRGLASQPGISNPALAHGKVPMCGDHAEECEGVGEEHPQTGLSITNIHSPHRPRSTLDGGVLVKTRCFAGRREKTTQDTPTFPRRGMLGVEKHQGAPAPETRGRTEDKTMDGEPGCTGRNGHGKQFGFYSEGNG